MNKYIVGLVAATLFGGLLFFADKLPKSPPGEKATSTGLSFPLIPETLKFPTLAATPVGLEAWAVFQDYLAAAKAHDLTKLKGLSYQLSPACTDPTKKTECETLMDSVVFFTEGFKQGDFGNIVYDDKQIVMSTDYMKFEGAEEPVKIVLYFVRTEGQPKVLGVRLCIGVEGENDQCVETSKAKRDSDQDGWWDDVEALFHK